MRALSTPLALLPDGLCLLTLCPLLTLSERLYALARVSQRWRRLALASLHQETTADLTWCTGEYELEYAVHQLTGAYNLTLDAPSKLQAVRLYGPRVSSSVLTILLEGKGAPPLQSIELESKQIDDDALCELRRCTRLTQLSLHCVKFTDKALISIAHACPQLQSVDLSGCSRIYDDGVISLARHCPRLKDLNLFMCHRITDRSMVALGVRSAKTIERIVVDRCLKISGLALRFLMKMQPSLCQLSCANCPKVLDSDFLALERQLPCSAAMMTQLDVSGCASLGDLGVSALVTRNSSTLRTLHTRGLWALSSVAYTAISLCAALQTLNLSMCRTLSNVDLEHIVQHCVKLKTLMLQGCVNIDDGGCESIARYSKQLKRLSLEFCYNITDEGVTSVVLGCPRLVDLNLKALNQLTTDTFANLIEHKSNEYPLQRINIGACADFETTVRYAAIIKRRFPRARVEWT
ncbi:hypothetical protein Poli38472_010647 [Pythium oligandrum]|uniref:F-box/LRR-repeat protein 15-like leucin rich repeat domain-containing protein n=1 Tax=Pythium oligandrum TaxID=41045 RepID=A0A8K1C3G9_PYTOL|nr:hypothetical protein Poli38472_010647 [Pythium oligandrum]|eukprot:TMW55765.1 hypothetical protein Poli38472_010647 [Pythium oligandrum]